MARAAGAGTERRQPFSRRPGIGWYESSGGFDVHCPAGSVRLPVPRTPYLIQAEDGSPIGVLLSVREKWQLRDTLVLDGRRYRVLAVVEFEAGDASGCAAALTVEHALFR